MRSIGSFSALAIVGALAVAGSASASTLSVDRGGTLRFTAAKGEVNSVDLNDNGGLVTTVTDPGSTIAVGAGCVQITPHQGQCPLPASFDQAVALNLGDGDDFAHAFKFTTGHIAISGGAGADTIEDLPEFGADVSGGAGNDTITVHPNFGGSVNVHGDAGSDSITATSASGAVNGDDGNDQITLNTFIEPVPGASSARGGFGNDTISANGPTDMGLVDGGFGDDTITTGTFADVAQISGGPGADSITSLHGTSQISGGFGADVVDGGGDGDTINCGLGLDQYVQYVGDVVSGCEIALP